MRQEITQYALEYLFLRHAHHKRMTYNQFFSFLKARPSIIDGDDVTVAAVEQFFHQSMDISSNTIGFNEFKSILRCIACAKFPEEDEDFAYPKFLAFHVLTELPRSGRSISHSLMTNASSLFTSKMDNSTYSNISRNIHIPQRTAQSSRHLTDRTNQLPQPKIHNRKLKISNQEEIEMTRLIDQSFDSHSPDFIQENESQRQQQTEFPTSRIAATTVTSSTSMSMESEGITHTRNVEMENAHYENNPTYDRSHVQISPETTLQSMNTNSNILMRNTHQTSQLGNSAIMYDTWSVQRSSSTQPGKQSFSSNHVYDQLDVSQEFDMTGISETPSRQELLQDDSATVDSDHFLRQSKSSNLMNYDAKPKSHIPLTSTTNNSIMDRGLDSRFDTLSDSSSYMEQLERHQQQSSQLLYHDVRTLQLRAACAELDGLMTSHHTKQTMLELGFLRMRYILLKTSSEKKLTEAYTTEETLRSQLENLKNEKIHLSSQLEAANLVTKDTKTSQEAIEGYQQRIADITDQLEQAQQENQMYQTDLSEYKTKMVTLQEEIEQLCVDKEELEVKYRESIDSTEKTVSNDQLDELNTTIERLQREHELQIEQYEHRINDDAQEHKIMIDTLQSEMLELKATIKHLRETNSVKDSNTLDTLKKDADADAAKQTTDVSAKEATDVSTDKATDPYTSAKQDTVSNVSVEPTNKSPSFAMIFRKWLFRLFLFCWLCTTTFGSIILLLLIASTSGTLDDSTSFFYFLRQCVIVAFPFLRSNAATMHPSLSCLNNQSYLYLANIPQENSQNTVPLVSCSDGLSESPVQEEFMQTTEIPPVW